MKKNDLEKSVYLGNLEKSQDCRKCPSFYASGVDSDGHVIISKTYDKVPDDRPTYDELRRKVLARR